MSERKADPTPPSVTRRRFLQTSAVGVGGLFGLSSLSGLVVGCNGGGSAVPPPVTESDITHWVQILPDNATVITVGFSEMGQGVSTALPMLIAEELDADWNTVTVRQPETGPVFTNSVYNTQVTAGSTSVVSSWVPLRQAGAKLRRLLLQAFVDQHGGAVAALTTADSVVTNTTTGQTATYASLAAAAAQLTPPEGDVPLKAPGQWTLIGQPLARLDVPAKVDGSAVFGIDVDVEGALVGTVLNCPVLGGSVKRVNPRPAMAVEGVRAVVDVDNAVVVVADTYWSAKEGAHRLYMESGERWDEDEQGYVWMGVEWEYGRNIGMSTEGISKRLRFGLHLPGFTLFRKGAPPGEGADRTLEAVYEVPFLAHGALEPMNCTAHVQAGQCEVWVPTQAQASVQYHVAELLGIPQPSVTVHTTFLGGAFGRRLNVDYILQAVKASRAVGQPVKLIWSREEDTRHDFYRPAAACRIRAGLDSNDDLASWDFRLVAPPFLPDWLGLDDYPPNPSEDEHEATFQAVEAADPDTVQAHIERLQAQTDTTETATESAPEGLIEEVVERYVGGFIAAEGAIVEEAEAATDAIGHRTRTTYVGLPYDIPSERVVYVARKGYIDVPLGFVRAVGPSYNVFFIESMIDEVAAATGRDPLAVRQALLAGQPRFLTVLDEAAARANWGSPPAGRFQGIAQYRGFSSIAAQVAEVSVQDGVLTVHKITCVVDCGPVINPDIAAEQVVGAVVFGLTAALYGTITIEQGRVLEANFDNYRLLPLSQMPEVTVHFIPNTNEDQIGGLGEVGTPLVAPAVANAVFAATGQRLRTLPFRLS